MWTKVNENEIFYIRERSRLVLADIKQDDDKWNVLVFGTAPGNLRYRKGKQFDDEEQAKNWAEEKVRKVLEWLRGPVDKTLVKEVAKAVLKELESSVKTASIKKGMKVWNVQTKKMQKVNKTFSVNVVPHPKSGYVFVKGGQQFIVKLPES